MRYWPVAAILLGACATTGTGAPTSYTESAQALYERGLDELDAHNYEQAIITFEQVRTRFPYSSYAALAELAIADTEFERGRYFEAIDAYEAFVRFHPTHPRLDYASYRIVEAHRHTLPSSFFIFPPVSERDPTTVLATLQAANAFLDRFSESEYAERARAIRREMLDILARHELAVARFHEKRGKWEGAAGRYRYLLSHYPGVGYDVEATLGLANAEFRAGRPEEARAILEAFLSEHDGEGVAEARRLLAEIEGSDGAP
ncbi:MAG TPA: outer membrane protein assembly factor BamD [Fredinandcohnia sp.]|nr:outer membrane protein assembly factor BamD [Fredinandcohnia sp.]